MFINLIATQNVKIILMNGFYCYQPQFKLNMSNQQLVKSCVKEILILVLLDIIYQVKDNVEHSMKMLV